MEILFLLLGLGALLLGSELMINGALDIAQRHKVSQLFIGLTILAFGTDLPELFVVISGSLHRLQGTETSGLIVGEAIGTVFGQMAFVLGVATFFGAMAITKRELVRDGITMLGSLVLLFIVSLDGSISRIDGAIFLVVYGLYFLTLFREEKLFNKLSFGQKGHALWAIVSIISGIVLLLIGSNLTVENALLLSEMFGVEQELIGILVVGLSTSLPELMTSINAVRKGAGSMAAGNIIGSNVFDILVTLGIGSLISEFTVSNDLLFFDLPFLFVTCIIALAFFRSERKVTHKEGLIVLTLYVVYYLIRLFVAV